ncbi:pentatricopeptide repeat-containing protein At5g18950, partial [Tripterygium wilfordii]|uniref:pentatricopeptide repeat-containing protein At5g18950 n=1 Tax=Tripterygium wilfordii TaxID=458696 RepID=UPI0018F8146D
PNLLCLSPRNSLTRTSLARTDETALRLTQLDEATIFIRGISVCVKENFFQRDSSSIGSKLLLTRDDTQQREALRAQSSIATFLRQNPRSFSQIPNSQIRNITEESKKGQELKPNRNPEHLNDGQQSFIDVAREVSKITRTRPRWEQTILSDFPSFNFADTGFFHELLKHQKNVLFSLQFFQWLHSCYGFVPDKGSCTVLFDALVEAMACSAAKSFLDDTGFIPEPGSFEAYVRCLFEGGLVEEGFNVYLRLKEAGVSASIKTCKSGFRGCLMAGRTDILWQLYQEMVASGIVADVDAETVGYLIQACCCNDELLKGYELLRQVLEDGLDPGNVAFNKLISGFCKKNNLTAVSELLHTMIARNCYPDIFSYQEVINGLCKKRKRLEALCVFNDLKDRGYAPNRVMYTTMIHGLCEMGCFGDARKLWFEMITKGITPNEYTYNALIHGFFKMGNFLEACKLHKEMCNQGFGETTVSYNTMISGFCLHGKTKVAYGLFEEMSKKGIVRDVKTYNYLIKCFCKEGKIEESQKLFEELLAQGLRPSTFSYTPLIRYLCQVGDLQEAKRLLQDMQNRDLQPSVYTYDHIVIGFYEQGNVTEGMEWLIEMLKRKLKPQKKTFEKLVGCLSQSDKLDDTLLVLDFMFRNGYALRPGLCHHLVTRLCKENPNFVERCVEEILGRN